MNERNVENVGDLSLTEEERRAVAEAEVLGNQAGLPARGGGLRWLRTLCLTAAVNLLIVAMIGLWKIMPSEAPPARPSATVAITRTNVHLREAPTAWSRSLQVIPEGQPVALRGDPQDGFVPAAYGTTSGHIDAAYVGLPSAVDLVTQVTCSIAAISGTARLREAASLQAQPLLQLAAGTPLTVMGYSPTGWTFVWTGRKAGFVWGGLLDGCAALPFEPCQENGVRVVRYGGRVLEP